MNKLYELLLMRKKEFDYSILFISFLVLCYSIILRHKPTGITEALIEIISPLLLGLCILGIWAWYRASRYVYYSKKIRRKYLNSLYKQEFKLRRLSSLELSVLNALLRTSSIRQIASEQKLPYTEIHRCIDILITKLDVHERNELADIDWKNAAGM